METTVDSLHPKTQEYIQNTDLTERKDMGQYFTNQSLINELFSKIPSSFLDKQNLQILDPASGTGEFLLNCVDRFDSAHIEGWELDSELVSISKDILPTSVSITETNTLFKEVDQKYDLIIGNPPYYEITRSEQIEEKFGDILYGRTNIYSLFIYKSLTMLSEGGYLAFINPPSMNNGAYFKKLREYIIENCSIEHLSVHEDAELFEGASQSIMFLVIKKGNTHNDYVFEKNGISIFSEDAEYLKQEFDGKKSLSELGYKVTTGKLVWNQNKEKLVEERTSDSVPIVWSKNITDEGVSIDPTMHNKPQFITEYEVNEGPAIVVNRIVGKPGSGSIRAGFIEEGTEFIGENHVNVIQAREDEKQLISFEEILTQLNSDKNVKIVQKLTGNNQISKTELEDLFPFKV